MTTDTFDSNAENEPIWERETVNKFITADNNKDWRTIGDLWSSISHSMHPNLYMKEMVACLNATAKGRITLAEVLDSYNSIVPITMIAKCLDLKNLCEISTLIHSEHAKFAITRFVVFDCPNRTHDLGDDDNNKISNLLRSVQKNKDEWAKWMYVFNRYPVRSKILQPALGLSLVNSQQNVIFEYINAIDLTTSHTECRSLVARCLSAFAERATLAQRQIFWKIAFERWDAWNFKENDREGTLTWLPQSQLDFAIVGYAVDNLSESDRQQKIDEYFRQMQSVTQDWHENVSGFNSSWYRKLGKWQLFYAAKEIEKSQAKIALPHKLYFPFDKVKNRYHALYLPTETGF